MRSNLLVTDSGQVKTARQTKVKTIFEAVVRLTEQKSVFKNFVKFIGKHLRHSLFFNKVAGLRPVEYRITLQNTCGGCFSINIL